MEYLGNIMEGLGRIYENVVNYFSGLNFAYEGVPDDYVGLEGDVVQDDFNDFSWYVFLSKRGKGREKKKPKGGQEISSSPGKKSGKKITKDKNGIKHVHRKRRGSRK